MPGAGSVGVLRGWVGRNRTVVLLVVAAFVVRVVYWALFVRDYVPMSDAAHYHDIARNLAEGRGFSHEFPQLDLHPTAFRAPLYPLTLGVVYALFWPAVGIAQFGNLLLGCVVVGLTYAVVRDIASPRAGTVAAAVVAVYPPLLANDVVPLTEPLALVLLLSLVWAVKREAYVWAGVLTGLLVLARTSAQAIFLIVAIVIGVRLGVRRAALTAALAALVVLPWVVRNQIQLDAPVLVTSNGFNLAALHSPEARETGRFVDPVYDPRFDEFRLDQFDEVVWDRNLREYALDNIRDDPLAVLTVVRRNLAALTEVRPSYNKPAERLDGRSHRVRTASLPIFWAVSVAGLVGVWRYRRDPTVQLLAVVVASFVVLNLFLVSPPRLRAPFDLLCAIGVGLLVGARERDRRDGDDAPDGRRQHIDVLS